MARTRPDADQQEIPMPTAKRTSPQELGRLIKSARDIMRKDKGLNGDTDRLPMLTWIMFLKFLDDRERQREDEAALGGAEYRPLIEAPYRWRDITAQPGNPTGDELKNFINLDDRAPRPDGTEGQGLFAHLRGLRGENGNERHRVVAEVFEGVANRMESGYLLRDVIDKVDGIHFDVSEEIHTLSALYESMLREMRDAAGDSGEFYTPRPVVRFMVEATDPRLGEKILDPACGTGGFLVEAFEYLSKQVQTVEDRRVLQEDSLIGGEAKPLPYLLGQMNLLLHGLENPNVTRANSLNVRLTQIGESDRVDVILTNPPFGGEEEKGILDGFPSGFRTAETALLFLQLIMRKLRRGQPSGRAAVVLPDGILSQAGVAARLRERLVREFRLHTIVRLPRGVFAPYTKSSTSILFFDAGPPADDMWVYDVPMRPDVSAYSQSRPFSFDELAPCLEWWGGRQASDNAWQVPVSDVASNGYSLNLRNASALGQAHERPPGETLKDVGSRADTLSRQIDRFQKQWDALQRVGTGTEWDVAPFSAVCQQIKRPVPVVPDRDYAVLAMSWYAKGLYVKHTKPGTDIKARKLYEVHAGDFVYNRLFAWKGSFAEATEANHGRVVSNEFPCFTVDSSVLAPGFLWAYFSQPSLWDHIETLSTGTTSTSRLRLKEARLAEFLIPIPPTDVQEQIVSLWHLAARIEGGVQGLGESVGDLSPGLSATVVPFRR